MTYEDYLIHSSELQHAFWSKKRPKYFKKDNGRYFYSRQEWEAFINKGRKKLDKAVTRFKKDATKQFKSYQKSARKDRAARQKRQSMERMERSRKFKQGLVDTKYALQNFSKNASKKMGELKVSASKQISRGKEFADICFANVRGQMNRFSDKVVKPGMAKAKAAAERIKASASKKLADIKAYAPEIVKAGRDMIRASLRIDDDLKNARTAEGRMNTSRLLSESTEYNVRRKGPPTRLEQDRINEAKQRYNESVKTYEAARERGEITQRELNDAKKRLRDNLNKLLGR